MTSFKGILNFIATNIQFGFNVANREAIKYFESKGLRPTFSYLEMQQDEHNKAVTVAKMMDMDMLQDVQDSITLALKKGWTYEDWSDRIIPILQSNGWWGRKEIIDPKTGQKVIADLGTPYRLKTIFRTNMQQAYMVGRWQQIMEMANERPYLRYDATDDSRTRPLHRYWNGIILPYNHKFWRTHSPLNGYNCRCSLTQYSKEDLEAKGYEITKNPDLSTVGIDAGFDYNAGLDHWNHLQDIANQKANSIKDKDLREAAQEALLKSLDDLPKIKKPKPVLPKVEPIPSPVKIIEKSQAKPIPKVNETPIVEAKNTLTLDEQKDIINQWIPDSVEYKSVSYPLGAGRIPSTAAKYDLTHFEQMVLRHYTGDGYYDLNQYLFGVKRDNELFNKVADLLNQALEKLPDYAGIVVRRTALPESLLAEHQIGNILTYDAFTSTTNGKKDVFSGKPHRLVIKSKTGKNVNWISKYKGEEYEVLFGRPKQFLVERRRTLPDGTIEIALREI